MGKPIEKSFSFYYGGRIYQNNIKLAEAQCNMLSATPAAVAVATEKSDDSLSMGETSGYLGGLISMFCECHIF